MNPPVLDLETPTTDAVINTMMAKHVAGLSVYGGDIVRCYLDEHSKLLRPLPDYLHDANLVLPFLAYHSWRSYSIGRSGTKEGYPDMIVQVTEICKPDLSNNGRTHEVFSSTTNAFCRSACLALLSARGVKLQHSNRVRIYQPE